MTSQTNSKRYYAELDGNYGHFATVADLQTWANDLIGRFCWLKGKTLTVFKADWIAADGSGMSYRMARQIVIGA